MINTNELGDSIDKIEAEITLCQKEIIRLVGEGAFDFSHDNYNFFHFVKRINDLKAIKQALYA